MFDFLVSYEACFFANFFSNANQLFQWKRTKQKQKWYNTRKAHKVSELCWNCFLLPLRKSLLRKKNWKIWNNGNNQILIYGWDVYIYTASSFFADSWMSSLSTLRKTNFFLFSGCKLFRVFLFLFSFFKAKQSSILCVISHCHFWMKIFSSSVNPTSLICFSSLPIPSNNSHIGYRRLHPRKILRFFLPSNSNLPRHLTNSCFSLSIYFVILLDCVVFFILNLRRMLILTPKIHPNSPSILKSSLSFM